MSEKKRILYVAGPGDIIGTFRHWQKGQDDPSQVAITFSRQFYDLCSDLDAEGYIISSHATSQILNADRFILEHRPILWAEQSAILYYLGQFLYGLSLTITAIRFRADYVVVCDSPYFFILALLPKLGIQVIPTLHCVLWPKYKHQSPIQKLIHKINGRFFQKSCLAILSTSTDITLQIQELTQGSGKPIAHFLSTYRCDEFKDISQPEKSRVPFHVLFAGRVENNKGVFDLLEIARRFKADGQDDIVFHICGTGSALQELKQQANNLKLGLSFQFHGYCKKPQMRQMFNLAHVVIVPTKSDFNEGLNQVVVEGVLTGRPVITSSICPALSYVREAVVEVAPDSVSAYAEAILKLKRDKDFYGRKQRSCKDLQAQFYDPSQSWGETLKRLITSTSPIISVQERESVQI